MTELENIVHYINNNEQLIYQHNVDEEQRQYYHAIISKGKINY